MNGRKKCRRFLAYARREETEPSYLHVRRLVEETEVPVTRDSGNMRQRSCNSSGYKKLKIKQRGHASQDDQKGVWESGPTLIFFLVGAGGRRPLEVEKRCNLKKCEQLRLWTLILSF